MHARGLTHAEPETKRDLNGISRGRVPVAAKIAFASAGAAPGMPISPAPHGDDVEAMKCTSTFGATWIRSSG